MKPPTVSLPLAAASIRLRGKPGRPRKVAPPDTAAPPPPVPEVVGSIEPRLLGVKAVAAYLGLSEWTVRDLEWAGTLKRVRIPTRHGELRKLLYDRKDLDELIERWKE